jgi:hypothetical protein
MARSDSPYPHHRSRVDFVTVTGQILTAVHA